MLAIHTILHPTDFSEHAQYAFGLACALARDYAARLVVPDSDMPPVDIVQSGYGGSLRAGGGIDIQV